MWSPARAARLAGLRCRARGAARGFSSAGPSARPLLQPPSSGEGAVQLYQDSGIDTEAAGVPTIAVIGPSRRGKSVLASLLAGGRPELFKQSHSSFEAMTSGTHVCELPGAGPAGKALRVIDTEGLSHVGRSRNKEALVRQFLISTYLTSSWLIWLDTEVLSTGFFTTMWLVHDYVVDVLRIRDAARARLPRIMYVRTQETEVQRREYSAEFANFGAFFERVMEDHEDAPILRQMFADDGIRGHALPVWTLEDLEQFEAGRFWSEGHSSPFRSSVAELWDKLDAAGGGGEGVGQERSDGPPLLALGALQQHLEKIAKLEAFDPRDHEAMKVARLRAAFRASYGKLNAPEGGEVDPVKLADLFDPEDRAVRTAGCDLDAYASARLQELCSSMRLEPEVAFQDPEVQAVLAQFARAAPIFSAAVSAYCRSGLSEGDILLRAVEEWSLDAEAMRSALLAALGAADESFLQQTGLQARTARQLRLRERLAWRIDECVMRLRARVATELELRPDGPGSPPVFAWVWRLGRWQAPQIKDGKAVRGARVKDSSLWTDGSTWAMYEEQWDSRHRGGSWVGAPRARGTLAEGRAALPVPGPSP